MQTPFVSIILPVFNDRDRLNICLRALEVQTWPRDSYEIIVVDNGSDEDIGPVTSQYPLVRPAFEGRKGSYAARNKGIDLARGEIFGFTDSDCIPRQDWIEKGVAALRSSGRCGLIAGRVDMFYKNPERLNAVELYERVRGFTQSEYVKTYHYGATANVFTYRSVVDEVGKFNAAMRSGGDREWGNRVHSSGYMLIYADEAVVAHPARSTLKELGNKVRRVTLSIEDRTVGGIVKSYARLLIPPVRMVADAWSTGKVRGFGELVKFLLVILYLRLIVMTQRTRLLLGGEARR